MFVLFVKKSMKLITRNTSSLFSFLLTMTEVICWSRKMRILARHAGRKATSTHHHGSVSKGFTNQPLKWEVIGVPYVKNFQHLLKYFTPNVFF